jgi:hypothetical protein
VGIRDGINLEQHKIRKIETAVAQGTESFVAGAEFRMDKMPLGMPEVRNVHQIELGRMKFFGGNRKVSYFRGLHPIQEFKNGFN